MEIGDKKPGKSKYRLSSVFSLQSSIFSPRSFIRPLKPLMIAFIPIYAAPFQKDVIKKILEGFHAYKPKCEERPQHPVDIWMIFDMNAYENIEYLHPRHKVVSRDKWELKKDHESGL
ncbi:MAG: hypothetical protein U5L95_00350 [Candidatus Saccharibacteria bacterium]|nr:hypothetical protein [Candidatus Saccharibacteria bacterium]